MSLQVASNSLIAAFNSLFYLSRFLGVIPYSFTDYYNYKKLKTSPIAIIWTIITIVTLVSARQCIATFIEVSESNDGGTLKHIIGVSLNHFRSIMMTMDLVSWLRNRQKVVQLFEEFNAIDINLNKQNIFIDNFKNQMRNNILIIAALLGEIIITTYTIISFDLSLLWFVSAFPTFLSTIDKIWFSSFMFALKRRFCELNLYIDQNVDEYTKLKNVKQKLLDQHENLSVDIGFLHNEIFNPNKITGEFGDKRRNKVSPIPSLDDSSRICKAEKLQIIQNKQNILNDLNNLEDKLNILCRLHDELCELGKKLNGLWNIQMLTLMAYGFITITAQFFFFYCSIMKQDVPSAFRSSQSIEITCIFVIYVAGKCVYVIFLSWQTKVDSRRTGVCVHKCAIAVDENNVYEIVNHISLKLMNHCLDFSACGFFNLDMTTVYGVTGAITSYLIILIQFNLASNFGTTNNRTATVGNESKLLNISKI